MHHISHLEKMQLILRTELRELNIRSNQSTFLITFILKMREQKAPFTKCFFHIKLHSLKTYLIKKQLDYKQTLKEVVPIRLKQFSLFIQALPFRNETPSCIIVINGLSGIIAEQQERFGKRCVTVNAAMIRQLENPDSMSVSKLRSTRDLSRQTLLYFV